MESVLPICRVCLNTSAQCINLQTPFQCKSDKELVTAANTPTKISYLECLRLCTQLAIDDHDQGAYCLCNGCESELQIVFKFLQKARNSQAILEENSGEVNQKVSSEQTKISIEKIDTAMGDSDLDLSVKADNSNEYSSEDDTFDISDDNREEAEECVIKNELEAHESQFLPVCRETSQDHSDNSEYKNNKCHICNRTYTTPYLLKIHLKYHETKRERKKSDACEICGKQFSTQRYLKQHMIVHEQLRETLKCNYCDKEYITKIALNNHKRIHKGETLTCSDCGKQFTRSYELKIHMRFHKREYPFECTMCDKKFAIKGHLRTHMWLHQGIKLECEECGKLFASTKALNEHSYTHGEMPFPCDFCNKSYPSRQKYKIHLDKVHSNEIMDLSQLPSLTNVKSFKKRKKFNYVKVIDEKDIIENKKLNQT